MTDKLETIIGGQDSHADAQVQKLLVMVETWHPGKRADQLSTLMVAASCVLSDIALHEGGRVATDWLALEVKSLTESLSDEFKRLAGELDAQTKP